MNENFDINDIIKLIDLEKINRFSNFFNQNIKNDKIINFYNDILAEIEKMVRYIAAIEEDNLQFRFVLNKEKEARLQMQLFIGMTFYISNTGQGADVMKTLTQEIDNYFIKDEEYYCNMIKLINNV